ncbi:MAG TPA: hypothetical protein PLM35_10065 [Cyclobacteriaceae bacterium]|nr:hypothetical protein [Cyclobacteriaceae bacterium]
MRLLEKILFVFLFLMTPQAMAQVEEQLTPVQKKQKTLVTEPQTLYKGFVRGGLSFSYGTVDKYFDANGTRKSFTTNIWASSWFVQAFVVYGVTDRLQVEFRLPYRVNNIYQSYDLELDQVETIKWNASGNGLGDVNVGLGYQLVTENPLRPSLTSYFTASLPTGKKNPEAVVNDREYKRPSGSGEPSLDVRLQVRRIAYPFSYTASVSYTYFFGGKKILDPLDSQERPFRSGNNFNMDGSFNFHLNDWIAIQNTLTYFLSGKDEFDGVPEEENSWVLQYYSGLSFQVKRFRINEVFLVPISGRQSSADPSYIFALSYVF